MGAEEKNYFERNYYNQIDIRDKFDYISEIYSDSDIASILNWSVENIDMDKISNSDGYHSLQWLTI